MHDSMNVAKITPCGISSPAGLSAGVQRNTKVYIDASKSDWMAPRMPTRGSAVRGEQGGGGEGDTGN